MEETGLGNLHQEKLSMFNLAGSGQAKLNFAIT